MPPGLLPPHPPAAHTPATILPTAPSNCSHPSHHAFPTTESSSCESEKPSLPSAAFVRYSVTAMKSNRHRLSLIVGDQKTSASLERSEGAEEWRSLKKTKTFQDCHDAKSHIQLLKWLHYLPFTWQSAPI